MSKSVFVGWESEAVGQLKPRRAPSNYETEAALAKHHSKEVIRLAALVDIPCYSRLTAISIVEHAVDGSHCLFDAETAEDCRDFSVVVKQLAAKYGGLMMCGFSLDRMLTLARLAFAKRIGDQPTRVELPEIVTIDPYLTCLPDAEDRAYVSVSDLAMALGIAVGVVDNLPPNKYPARTQAALAYEISIRAAGPWGF